MKSYVDLNQARRLAEILPLESADLVYFTTDGRGTEYSEVPEFIDLPLEDDDVPCWSLAGLLDILKDNINIKKTGLDQSDMFTYSIIGDGYDYKTYEHKELIDACYEMIVKLHRLNKLVL